jgi:hypothetical protein
MACAKTSIHDRLKDQPLLYSCLLQFQQNAFSGFGPVNPHIRARQAAKDQCKHASICSLSWERDTVRTVSIFWANMPPVQVHHQIKRIRTNSLEMKGVEAKIREFFLGHKFEMEDYHKVRGCSSDVVLFCWIRRRNESFLVTTDEM